MSRLHALWPGLLLSGAIGAVAIFLHRVESQVLPHPRLRAWSWPTLGVVFRQLFGLPARCQPGQSYAAKQLLEAAVLLFGATMDLRQLFSGGAPAPRRRRAGQRLARRGAFIGRRLFRLERKPAILIAVGNAICGNSAIATIAPLVAASTTEVAGAIAFTAIIGVGLVLLLPLLIGVLHLSHGQYGVLVGMSVYAVPQVLAASYPVSEAAGQVATLVVDARAVPRPGCALLQPARAPGLSFDGRSRTAAAAAALSVVHRRIYCAVDPALAGHHPAEPGHDHQRGQPGRHRPSPWRRLVWQSICRHCARPGVAPLGPSSLPLLLLLILSYAP